MVLLSLLVIFWQQQPLAATNAGQFSGGQRQRIGIARALAMRPEVLIADESVSALDVSVQKQVLELLAELQQRLNLSILFITHDLRVAAQISDYIAVMRQGEVVEYGTAEQVLLRPQNTYTQTLLAAAPGASELPTAGPVPANHRLQPTHPWPTTRAIAQRGR